MTPPTSTRSPLTRQRVAEAALARIDADGLDALSMRKLGADLGVEAMSLYNHVRNKDDLLTLVGELLTRRILDRYFERAGGDWKERCRAMATSWWEVGLEHPRAFALIADRPVSGPEGVAMLAACMQLFTDSGFSIEASVEAFQAASGLVVGVIQQEIKMIAALANGEGFSNDEVPPQFAALIDFRNICLGTPGALRFAKSLELLLAGIEARLAPASADAPSSTPAPSSADASRPTHASGE